MIKDDELVSAVYKNVTDSLTATEFWRNTEVRDSYNVVEGQGQWLWDDYSRQKNNNMPIHVINKVAPIIDAVSGFEIQNRTETRYTPRLPKEDQEGFSDMLGSAVKYIEQSANVAFHNSLAFRDMLICGVGATETYISHDKNPDGETVVRRVFPYFLMWDVAAREKNLEDATWVMQAKIMSPKDFKSAFPDHAEIAGDKDSGVMSTDARFLQFFDTILPVKQLLIIYQYEWRERETYYRVENPFYESDYFNDPLLIEYAVTLADKLNFNLESDRIFSVEKEDFKEVKQQFEALGLTLNSSPHKKFRYYRALICNGQILKKSENFSQQGFSIKFMTGKFSEVEQTFYGLVRGCKDPQRIFNQTISDFVGFLQTSPKGGVEIEADAVPDLQAFINTYTKSREVTVYAPGGLMKSRPKTTAPLPAGIAEMLQVTTNNIFETTGVTNEFMGISDSLEMTAALQAQRVRQGLTILAPFFDAKHLYMIEQGRLFIDCVRVMAENNEGRLITNIVGEGSKEYVPLLKDNIAQEYDVIVEEMPQTPNERQQVFEQMLELAQVTGKVNELLPVILRYSPLKATEVDQLVEALTPPPEAPDPLTTRLISSQADMLEAQARRQTAEATLKEVEAEKELATIEEDFMQTRANIEKTISEVELNHAKTMNTEMGSYK